MLVVNEVSKYFGKKTVVKDLDFKVSKGEVVGIVGPNGAGKSTTLKMCSGILKPDKGSITVEEGTLEEKVGIVFQQTEFRMKLTVAEFLRLMETLNESAINREEVVEIFNLYSELDRSIMSLSGGNKKKINMAAGMLKNPDYLLLDEPTAGLDLKSRKRISQLVRKFKRDKGILISTHELNQAEKICDRVIIIEKGQKVVSGETEKLIDDLDGKYSIKIKGNIPKAIKESYLTREDFFEIKTDNPYQKIKDLADFIGFENLEYLTVEKPGLEEVYVHHTGARYNEEL